MNAFKTTVIGFGIFLVLVLFSAMYIVTEGQHAIMLRLGRLVKDNQTDTTLIISPGLHFKWPFIENVRIFDTRLQTMDIKSSRIVTNEKKDVMVAYYVKWRISNLAQYFRSTGGNEFKAESLLEQQLNTLLRAQIGKRTIQEVVTGGREDIMKILRKAAEKQAGELGIHVVDVRIKGIELPSSTSNAIFQRMRADMRKIANKHRADGKAQAEKIQAKADADVTVLLATTQSEAQKIRAVGQAQAAEIYAKAYGQNQAFFTLYRSLLAYEKSFHNKSNVMVLDQSSAFFDYFKQGTVKSNSATGKK